jgi:transcriptional regulator with XRE-family HTH domain
MVLMILLILKRPYMTSLNSSIILSNLAYNLKSKRKALQLTQEEFADLCGLHRTYIGAIERAERNITLSTLESIASAVRIQPHSLIKPQKIKSKKTE